MGESAPPHTMGRKFFPRMLTLVVRHRQAPIGPPTYWQRPTTNGNPARAYP